MSDVITDTNTAMTNRNGALNSLSADLTQLQTDVTQAITDVAAVNVIIADQATTLIGTYGETTPPLVIEPGPVVSVVDVPETYPLTPQNDAYAAAVAEVIAPLFAALGDEQTAYVLTERAQAGPEWETDLPNPFSR